MAECRMGEKEISPKESENIEAEGAQTVFLNAEILKKVREAFKDKVEDKEKR